MNDAALLTTRSSRHGRTAWIVLAIGVAAAVTMNVAAAALSLTFRTGEEQVIAIMGLLIGLVFCGWAGALGLRALYFGEKSARPLLLLNVVALLLGGATAWLWREMPRGDVDDLNWAQMQLPILGPFFAFAFITGCLPIRWMLRRGERKQLNSGAAHWPPRERARRAVAFGLVYCALLAPLLLPVPLYLASAARASDEGAANDRYLNSAPDFVRDAGESILSALHEHHWHAVQNRVLKDALVSIPRLQARTLDLDPEIAASALLGLSKRDPAGAANIAEWRLMYVRFPVAEMVLGKCGSAEQRARHLDRIEGASLLYHSEFFEGLAEGPPDVVTFERMKQFAKDKRDGRECALLPLMAWFPRTQFHDYLLGLLDKRDGPLNDVILNSERYRNAELMNRIMLAALDHQSALVRQTALLRIIIHADCFQNTVMVQKLLSVLPDRHSAQRNMATRALLAIMRDESFGGTRIGIPTKELSAPEIDIVRTKAEKWLKEHEK